MPNGIKYVLMAIVFVILAKALQVVAFDSKHYEKMQRESDSKYYSLKKSKKASKKSGLKEEPKNDVPKKKNTEKRDKQKPKIEEENSALTETNYDTNDTLDGLKNTYLAPLLATMPEGQLREDIVIRYYRHKKDLEKVDKLRSLSYYIHEKEAIETAGLGSNTMYYGDDVPLEDIQIIAFTLLKEGIPLKSIKHTKFEWKAKAIEIGTDTTLLNEPNLSAEQIRNFHKQYSGN